MLIALPAICDTCGAIFPSGYSFGPGTTVTSRGNKSGPCPNGHPQGSVPDGVYRIAGAVLPIISTWTDERRQHLATSLQTARQDANPCAATDAVLGAEPELREVIKRLTIPREASAFYTLMGVLIAILMWTSQGSGPTININLPPSSQPLSGQHAPSAAQRPPTKPAPNPPRKKWKGKKKRGR
jgi:hypothetical protein